MKVFCVHDSPVRNLENEIPIEVQWTVQEGMLERQRRLLGTAKESSLALAKLREKYKGEIRQLVGAQTIDKHMEQYNKLLTQMAEIPTKSPCTRDGEEENAKYKNHLKKEKHELYHSLGFDTKKAIVLRKKYLRNAREILERSIEPDAEMPAGADTTEPKPTSNPWTWVFPPYAYQWTHVNESNGSRGSRSYTLSASAASGEISLWNRMQLFGVDDSDWSRVDIMSEVGIWFHMPAAGLVEVWTRYQDINTDYTGQLWDESGCSDADVQQFSRAYLWTIGSTERYSTIIDYHRGESEGTWAKGGPTSPGQTYSKHLFSNKSYAAGEWVYLAVGVRDMNYFWVDDMSCRSIMTSRWFVSHVVVRSTGAP